MDKEEKKKLDSVKNVIYKPCKFCFSLEYDQADGDVVDTYEGQVYEPECCDQCCYGSKAPKGTLIH